MSWGRFGELSHTGEDSFWPSFTDIMMVIVMVFLLVTVAVVLTNTKLLDELRHSVAAEEAAEELAEHRLQENATLEEQLEYFQQRVANLEMEVLRGRASSERLREQLAQSQQQIQRLNLTNNQQQSVLNERIQALSTVQSQLATQQRKNSELETSQLEQQASIARLESQLEQQVQRINQLQQEGEALKASRDEKVAQIAQLQNTEQDAAAALSRLQGEYAELDKKYQKLVRPARSKKNKTVVDVMYDRNGYRIRKAGEGGYRNVSRAALDIELTQLKESIGDKLYVKIIIPENSGLSYNEAWRFTRDTLNRYDYYYQPDINTPASTSSEEATTNTE